MRPDGYNTDCDSEMLHDMNRCCTIVTLLSKLVLLLVCGAIFLVVLQLE